MYGNVIKNVKKNKTVQYLKEQNLKIFSKIKTTQSENLDLDLNKNTKSDNEDQHRKYNFYRQYTLQTYKNGENNIRRSPRTKNEENVSALGKSSTEAQGEWAAQDNNTEFPTPDASESLLFHSVYDLTDDSDLLSKERKENQIVEDSKSCLFKETYFNGEDVNSDFLNRESFYKYYKENTVEKDSNIEHEDCSCRGSEKKSDSFKKDQKYLYNADAAESKDKTSEASESKSSTLHAISRCSLDEGSVFFESFEKFANFGEKDEDKTPLVNKDHVFRHISSFLNELKDFLRDNTHYDLNSFYQGLKESMAQPDGSTKDGNPKVSPRRRMTVSSEDPASKDSKYHLKERLCEYVLNDIIGCEHRFRGPWGGMPMTYLDYVASGRPLRCLEDYIRDHVMPTYANTHTEVSFTAGQTGMFREEAREVIKASVNASKDDVVIFTGSGSTSAVNKLIHVLKPSKPLVLVGPYEHHSNILPWTEIKGANVVRIQSTKDGLIDLDHLEWELKKGWFHKREVIGAFSAASNVTGILTDVNAVCTLLHRHKGIALFDYACAAPYVDINMNSKGRKDQDGLAYKDAVFISTHKFIGGPGTPGLLIAKKHLFRNKIPHNVGGGTVQFVRRSHVSYRIDIEEREEGGTPAIIESIRAGLVFKLKDTFTASFIMLKEEELLRKAKLVWSAVPGLILLGNLNAARLPIFPMLYYNYETGLFLHHDFVAMVLNDVFGIQVRSGCACAGPYAMDLIGLSEEVAMKYESTTVWDGGEDRESVIMGFKPGFVRLNCPYFFTDETFNFVLKAVQMVATHGWKILYLYDFDPIAGKWKCKLRHRAQENKHLQDISFSSGRLEVNLDEKQGKRDSTSGSEAHIFKKLYQGEDAQNYVDILKRAQRILTPNKEVIEEYSKVIKRNHVKFTRHHLRWFMLPEECIDLLSGKAVMYLPPEELPFFPGSLGVKLGMSQEAVMKHKARRNLDINFPVEATGSAWEDGNNN